MKSSHILFCFLVLVSSSALSSEISLFSAYQRALDNDARFGAARAAQLAGQEELPKGLAGLLPSASFSAQRGNNKTESTTPSLLGDKTTKESDYISKNYSLTLRQPLYKKYNVAQYQQAKASVGFADATFEKEKLQLMLRTTDSYLDVLLAQDNIHYTQAQKQAIDEQLQQAKRLYEAGFGTITDVSEAQARYDSTIAQELEAVNHLEVARRALEEAMGSYPDALQSLDPARLPLDLPEPNNVAKWIELATSNNPDIVASRFNLEASAQEVEKNRAGHFPTVDLVASRTLSESDTNYTINSKYDTTSVGVQVSLPIFSGGYVNAAVRQAVANKERSRQQMNNAVRTAGSDARKAFLDIVNGIAQIKALEQAVKSNKNALLGTQKSFEAGIRSNVDVLNAQQQLYSSLRDLAKARYFLISNRVKLKAAAGILGEGDLQQINGWLVGS